MKPYPEGKAKGHSQDKTLRISPGILLAVWLGCGSLQAAEDDLRQRMDQLEQNQQAIQRQLNEKDQTIERLQQQLASQNGAAATAVESSDDGFYGNFIPGKGFLLANTGFGEISFSAYTYLRYLNQTDLDHYYTDSFGRARELDIRNDLQLQKAVLYFKGWVYDPDLRYVFYTWTSNTSQGDGAQVVVAGYLIQQFNDAFNLGGGISALPSTRSLEGQWPNMLKVDYRTIADEFFRGSYTTGIFAQGTLQEGLKYKAMVGNNLSQLGVNAAQLDDNMDTFSMALWWMPSTGEYGKAEGFGDFEQHESLATRVGLHYTHSTEDRQAQPGAEDPENSQIRLSDGTSIFAVDAFGPGIRVNQARYQMVSLDAGMKLNGFALEGEYYWRWVDQFKYDGALPVDSLYDHGFQLQASMMLVPATWQVYLAASKIQGEYGNPYDIGLGVNWFPLKDNRKLRVHGELLYLEDSPVGYSSVPFAIGGNGVVLVTDLELAF